MVAHLLRLRAELLLGALRRPQRPRSIVLFLLTVAATVTVTIGTASLAHADTVTAATVITLGGAALILGFFVAPILTGARDPLDPRQFRVFGVDEKWMPAQLALAGIISVPSAAAFTVTITAMSVATAHGAPVAWSVLLGIISYASTLLAARIGMGISAILLPERRPRELTMLFSLGVIVIAFPLAAYLASREWNTGIPPDLVSVTHALGVTPLGAAAASAFAFAQADTASAWNSLAVALATLVVLSLSWVWGARRLLRPIERPTSVRERAGLGWFAVLPSNAFGAIAARSLIYWLRDRRYIVNMIVIPVAAVLAAVPLRIAGVPAELALMVPVLLMALFFGWLPHNDVAYDSTAFWVHVASGVDGIADRLGRIVPIVLVAVPVLAVAVPITLTLQDDWSLIVPLSATVACLFLSGLGISNLVSVLAPYAVSRPGDSPFQQPQRSSGHSNAGHAIALLATIAASTPALWLLYREITVGGVAEQMLQVGLGIGGGVFIVGTVLGAIVFSYRSERLMEFVEAN